MTKAHKNGAQSGKSKARRTIHRSTLAILRFLKERGAISKSSALLKKKGVTAGCRKTGWDSISDRGWIKWVNIEGSWAAYLTPAGHKALLAATLREIKDLVAPHSAQEQGWLIQRLESPLRNKAHPEQSTKEQELEAMAADPAIRRELEQIEREFAPTEGDGLENL